MAQQSQPVTVVRAKDVSPKPPARPVEFMKGPYAAHTAIRCDTSVPIRANKAEREEGARRSLSAHESVHTGIMVIGPGGGEAWHTHLSYFDVIFYVLSGRVTFWWKHEGKEPRADLGPGDFVHMSPKAKHQWLNTGKEDLKLVSFVHFHNYRRA